MEKLQFPQRLYKVPRTDLCSRKINIWGRWIYEVAYKMTEGSETKQ